VRAVVPFAVALILLAPACGSNGEEAATTTAAETADPTDAVLGDYEREMTEADIERTAAERRQRMQKPSPGRVRLVIRDGVMQVFVPEGFSISQELTVTEDEWRIGPYIGSGMDAFCPGADRPATYTWKVEGEELMLSPKDDACADRDSTLTGTWTRTG
jgi:hypothetical protein